VARSTAAVTAGGRPVLCNWPVSLTRLVAAPTTVSRPGVAWRSTAVTGPALIEEGRVSFPGRPGQAGCRRVLPPPGRLQLRSRPQRPPRPRRCALAWCALARYGLRSSGRTWCGLRRCGLMRRGLRRRASFGAPLLVAHCRPSGPVGDWCSRGVPALLCPDDAPRCRRPGREARSDLAAIVVIALRGGNNGAVQMCHPGFADRSQSRHLMNSGFDSG
jgi:hypothetical protein